MAISLMQSDHPDQSSIWLQALNATLNILEDFQEERSGTRESSRAVLNILADFEEERGVLSHTNRAMLNILQDFEAEKDLSLQMNRAVVNILEDLEEEKAITRMLNAHLEERVLERTAELQLANESLERSNIDLQRFAYIASHDLQTPLRSISGFVQLLQSEYANQLDEQAHDWIRRAVQSTEILQKSIQDLLSYSRVDTEAHPFTPILFSEVFNDAILLLEASIQDSSAQVTCDELPIVMGDRSQLVQLMQNLIGNALKYRGNISPCVHVSAVHEGNEWTISVRDNGIGIQPKHYEKIFEIFQRLHNQQEYGGSGIGLAVCRRVVHRHGGKIWVESEPGRGSTFYFTIPERITQPHE